MPSKIHMLLLTKYVLSLDQPIIWTSFKNMIQSAPRREKTHQRGDCNHTFCQAEIPDNKRMSIRSPGGDPGYAKD